MERWWRSCVLAGVVAALAVAGHLAWGVAARPSEPDPDLVVHGVGPATSVVALAERFRPATLAEVAALSDLVVEGTVTRVERGPIVGDATTGLGLLRATIEVDETYRGPRRRSVDVLVTGFRPADGEILKDDLALELDPGDHGIWFLRPAAIAGAPGAYVASTSAGTILRTDRGTSLTGGDLEAGSVTCRRSWPEVRRLVTHGIDAAASLAPLAAGTASPAATPGFVGNPCAFRPPRLSGQSGR
jgi:hypothetical protein